jgi:hypothetical protein
MPTVTLDVGGLDLVVPCQRAGKAPKRRVGDRSYAFAGNERSHIRAELMVIPLVFVNSTPAICSQIEQMFAMGNQVDCSGDVFNNGGATVTCSGDYTDEMEQGGGYRVPGLTLYEVENDYTTAGGSTTDTTLVTMSNTPSVDDPTAETANIGGAPPGECFFVLESATPAECSSGICPISYSPAAERVWLTAPLAATTLSGRPEGILVSKGTEGGSAFTYQSSKLVVYLCRGGTDVVNAVEGPIESEYRAGSFFGGVITLPFPSAIAWDVLDGDVMRIELWSRIALAAGASDPDSSWALYRQTICYGGGTGVRFGGTLEELP